MLYRQGGFLFSESPLRRQMEWAFSSSFDDVVIHDSACSHALNREMKSIAFTVGKHVFFGEGSYRPKSPAGRYLLAHELAHVVQKRLGPASGLEPGADLDTGAIEEEAEQAALVVSTGGRFQCRLPDLKMRPAPWACAGHYYTVYLAYLNAQASDSEALKTALYCWLPDQVNEFDAFDLFMKHVKQTAADMGKITLRTGNPLLLPLAALEAWEAKEAMESRWKYLETVHRGIHCLNGGDALAETALREKIITEDRTLNILLRGIAHHSYGDSFAHRDVAGGNKMYGTGYGHGRQLYNGHDPDNIWHESRRQTYQDYVTGLLGIACAWTKKPPAVPLESFLWALEPMLATPPQPAFTTSAHLAALRRNPIQADLRAMLDDPFQGKRLANGTTEQNKTLQSLATASISRDEAGCCQHMQNVAARLLGRPMRSLGYDPDRPARPWKDYYMENRHHIDEDTKTQGASALVSIFAQAAKWSRQPR